MEIYSTSSLTKCVLNPPSPVVTTHEKCHQLSIPKTTPFPSPRIRVPNNIPHTFFTFLDNFITKFMDLPLRPSIDPKQVLSGNFAPVDELPPTECPGHLPPSLNGTYIRNGPNPQFIPSGPYHIFDGDGMLHAITISNGKATFCSRFVKTYKYNLERAAASPVVISLFASFNGLLPSLARCIVTLGRIATGIYDPRSGFGVANTSLALIGGKLFALGESDLPYEVKLTSNGDIITLGRQQSLGRMMNMTAHPKIDVETGEVFAFRYSITAPYLTYFRISPDGVKQPDVQVFSLKKPSLVHDFAVSQNYAVFPDPQIVIEPVEILRGKAPVRVDEGKLPRLGIMPKYAVDEREIRWIEVPGLNVMHTVNMWEENGGDTVVMVATNTGGVEHVLERLDLSQPRMEIIEIDVKGKTVRRRILCDGEVDFAVINPAYASKKNRYVYAAIGVPMPKIGGIVKIDLSLSTTDSTRDCTVASHMYAAGCYGGEPYFVPKEPNNPAAEEDDGYLLTYLHNEDNEESEFIVMDARSPDLEIVAAVKLPGRVPYGFHGLFVPQTKVSRWN